MFSIALKCSAAAPSLIYSKLIDVGMINVTLFCVEDLFVVKAEKQAVRIIVVVHKNGSLRVLKFTCHIRKRNQPRFKRKNMPNMTNIMV